MVLLGGGDLDAGIIVADDGQDRRVGYDALRVGDAGIGVALIVEGGDLDFEAELDERAGELLDRRAGRRS